MLIAGWCSDNLGRKPIILFGTLIFFLASLSAGLSITEKQFLISRFFKVVGQVFVTLLLFAILRDTLTEQQRAKVLFYDKWYYLYYSGISSCSRLYYFIILRMVNDVLSYGGLFPIGFYLFCFWG